MDIDRANRTKQRIKYLAHKTFTRGVLSEIGGFGGLFAVDKTKYLDPVLVSSVDGVGTKLKIAFEMGLHSTVGADLVNHCVNDIAVQGAAPLFFMDYPASSAATSNNSLRASEYPLVCRPFEAMPRMTSPICTSLPVIIRSRSTTPTINPARSYSPSG